MLSALPGSSSGCTAVGSRTTVRSESVGAGNFTEARARFSSARQRPTQVDLYFIPRHRIAGVHLTLVATSPSGRTHREATKRSGTANGWRYYNARVPISEPGRWRFDATIGKDHGCFIATFAQ